MWKCNSTTSQNFRTTFFCQEPGERSLYNELTTGWMIQVSNPGRGYSFISSPKRPDKFWGPPSLLLVGTGGSLPERKQPGRDAAQSHPSSVEVKNKWSCTSTRPTQRHGAHENNFVFAVYSFSRRCVCVKSQLCGGMVLTGEIAVSCRETNRNVTFSTPNPTCRGVASGCNWCGLPGRQSPRDGKMSSRISILKKLIFCAEQIFNYEPNKEKLNK
jgi:hypothetical protein